MTEAEQQAARIYYFITGPSTKEDIVGYFADLLGDLTKEQIAKLYGNVFGPD